MILKHIVEFAEKHASGTPSGYSERLITKIIQLRADGTLQNVVAPSGTIRNKRSGMLRQEPTLVRTSGTRPLLISDGPDYVLGKAQANGKSSEERHKQWCELVDKAAQETATKELQAICTWIRLGGPDALRDDPRIEPADELTFEVGDQFVTDMPAVRTFWATRDTVTGQGQCLITGSVGPTVELLPSMIKGIPGGKTSGNALISMNNAAETSYGLQKTFNAPISPDAAEKLCNGLNMLINEGQVVTDEKGKERKKYKYALRVGPTVYLAWAREETDFDPWSFLDQPDPAHVHQLIDQARAGGLGPTVAEADFFVLSLSANAARIVVRDYHETTLTNVKANLAKWFRRLQLAGTDGKPSNPIGIYRLAASLYRDANKEMPAHVPASLVNAAVSGRPLPDYLLGLAVKRNQAMQGPFSLTLAKTKTLSVSRLSLIKAVLTPNPEDMTLNQLNKEQPNPAYHCGRMLAVLESIQRIAIPGLNATLVDRNYGAACASPASIFGNLLKDATSAHLPKLRKNRPGAYIALDQRLQEVAVAIGSDFPKTLNLKDQGLFSLGYYHQRAWDLSEAKKNKELKELAETAASLEEESE